MAQKKKFEYSQYAGFVQVLKFAQQFSSPGKSLENRESFFEVTVSALQVNFLLCWPNLIQSCLYVCSTSWKKLCSFIFFKVSIDHLFDNLESGSKNLYEP